jgi:uncharacterized protein
MEVSLAPTLGQERIHAIDVLRGVAVLGILILNIRTFALPGSCYFNPTIAGVGSTLDEWVFWTVQLLGDQKFMSIFSMLFGAGIVLMADRVLAKGGSPGGIHYKRMAWLLVIGLIHAYLVWYGDILVSYALCGMLVFPLRRLPIWLQAALGTALLCVGAAIWAGLGWSMQFMPPEEFVEVKAQLVAPTAQMLEDEAAIKLGTWVEQLPHRASEAFMLQTFVLLAYSAWRVCGLMLLGMAFFRWGIFSAKRSTGFYCALVVLGGVAGVALSNWTLELNEAIQWGSIDILFINSMPAYFGGVLTAMAWVGVVMAVCKSGVGPICRLFACAGRMALTNYIAQSLLCSVLFYGWGLGLYGLLSYAEQWTVILSIWVLELIWSTWWLSRFHFGPLEWVWRSLVLMSAQTMRKEAL